MKLKLAFFYLFLIAFTLLISACNQQQDPLPSWNNTASKAQIINFINRKVPQIPLKDRIAVFDMDGTLACEAPLWMEMYAAVQGLCMQVKKDSSLLRQPIYQYAEKLKINPKDTSVINHWGPDIDKMVLNAFKGWDNEDYINFSENYLAKTRQPDYKIPLAKTFYPPMKELISYLKQNKFQIYIVSGSLQGLLYSVCPEELGIDRAHLIGTRQSKSPIFHSGEKTDFILKAAICLPGNNNNGKALNIYNRIGKTPVFAFGNTIGDFGMFRLTSTNPLPHISFLLNHDDAQREYVYAPWHGKAMPAWKDTMKINQWHIVNMKENFKTVFPAQN